MPHAALQHGKSLDVSSLPAKKVESLFLTAAATTGGEGDKNIIRGFCTHNCSFRMMIHTLGLQHLGSRVFIGQLLRLAEH